MFQNPDTANRKHKLIVGIGLAIQGVSLAVIYLMWKHHQHYFYALPLSVIGMFITLVPMFRSETSRMK